TENLQPADSKIHSMLDTEYWWLSASLLEHWQFPEPIVSVFKQTPGAPIPKMKTVILGSNLILKNLREDGKIPDQILTQVLESFEQSGLSGVDFQDCVDDSEKLCLEMAGWMFA
ncbi:MAG: hypothetical protein ABW044_08705, partial [Cellvibrio sp.]